MEFSNLELDYLKDQTLGRLATVDPDGRPQNNPVSYTVNPDGTVDIGGWSMATTRKWRNIGQNQHVALVIDDIISISPWTVRGVEIRGHAIQTTIERGPDDYMTPDIIRITPDRVIAWGLDATTT